MEFFENAKSEKSKSFFSKEIIYNDNQSLIKKLNSNKLNKNYLLNYKCPKCFGSTMINSIFKEEITIYLICDCLCSQIENITIDDFYKEYTYKELEKNNSKIKIFNHSICNEHKGVKLEYYCKDCKKDLCSNCIGEIHINHILTDFNSDFFRKIINNINEIYEKIHNDNKDKKEFGINKNYFNVLRLLKNLISVNENFPCFSIYNSIINVNNFFLKSKNDKFFYDAQNNEENNIKIIKLKDRIIKKKIRFPREFKENLRNEKINSIYLNKRGFDNINIMMKNNFDFLEILELEENNIISIAPLIKKEFPELKILNLEKNRLGNNNIKSIENLIAPKLEILDLFGNNFTDFNIVKSIYHFEKLITLYLGGNKFIFNENFNETYELPNLEIIGLSFGVFSDENIKYVSNIKFEKLQTLYLNCNNLHSLEFVKNIIAPNLEQFYFMMNYIDDFEPLINYKDKFKKITKINLKYNLIKNISNLQTLIDSYPKVKEIIISENYIDINNSQIQNIFKNIYKNNIQLEIY